MANSQDGENSDLYGKCRNKVENDAKAMWCEGFCGKWFHIKCVNVKSNNYEAIQKLSDDVIWMCKDCEVCMSIIVKHNPKKILGMCMNGSECNNEILIEINNRIKSLESKVINNNFAPKLSYAEIAKQSSENKESYNEGIIIKPKRGTENENTLNVIKQKIDPSNIGVPIKKIKNGGVIIKSDKKENNNKLVEEAKNKLGNSFEVRTTKQRIPTLCIPKMKKEYSSEMLKKELKALNYQINDEDEAKVIYCRKNNITNKYTIYIEVNKSLYMKINNKHVNIGWDTVLVREDYGVVRCYKCQRFNHKSINCTANSHTCKNCGDCHKTSECRNQNVKCINCKLNPKLAINCNHTAGSWSCPILQNKIKQQIERTNYNINKLYTNVK